MAAPCLRHEPFEHSGCKNHEAIHLRRLESALKKGSATLDKVSPLSL